jgi:hypothetical protein
MKLNLVAAGLVAAFASAGAVAAPGITLPATVSADIYISGATSLNPILTAYLAKNCSTLDLYQVIQSTTDTSSLYNCVVGNTGGVSNIPGITAGATIAIHKSSTSSSDGVVPVANQTVKKFLSQADAQTAGFVETSKLAVTVGTGTNAVTIGAYKRFDLNSTTVPGSITTQAPEFGFSDVEPALFTTKAIAAKVTANSVYTLVFAVPVTKKFRDDLQTLEGLVSGSDTLANMPSLTSRDLSGIYSGKILDAGALGLPAGQLNVGRRSDGSGTTKVFSLTFLNAACGGTTPFVAANSTIGSKDCTGVAANRVVQMGTSDDMVACLNKLNTANAYGVGIISTEYNPTATDGYRFIRVDGAAPSLLNTTEGRYPVWGEGSINIANTVTVSTAASALYADLTSELSRVAVLAAVNADQSVQTLGGYVSGLLAKPTSATGAVALGNLAYPITAAQMAATPVNLYTHGGDSCAFATSTGGADTPFTPE